MPLFLSFSFFSNKFTFIGIQFAHIQNNTQCSARQYTSHIHPHPHPPPLPSPLVHFPELGVFMFCLPFWYFPHISSPFPYIPFTIIYIPQMNENIQCFSLSDWLTSLSEIPSSSIHFEANGGYLLFLMSEKGPPILSLHLLSLLWYECYCFNKWMTSLRLSLWSITILVLKASTWDCISVIPFLTLAWLNFSSFISTVRDSLVFFCALFPAQLLSF